MLVQPVQSHLVASSSLAFIFRGFVVRCCLLFAGSNIPKGLYVVPFWVADADLQAKNRS